MRGSGRQTQTMELFSNNSEHETADGTATTCRFVRSVDNDDGHEMLCLSAGDTQ